MFYRDSKLHKLDLPPSIHHSCELEYMLRCKVKAEIEILHEVGASDVSGLGSPSTGLPLVRYLANHINSTIRSSSTAAEIMSFESEETEH